MRILVTLTVVSLTLIGCGGATDERSIDRPIERPIEKPTDSGPGNALFSSAMSCVGGQWAEDGEAIQATSPAQGLDQFVEGLDGGAAAGDTLLNPLFDERSASATALSVDLRAQTLSLRKFRENSSPAFDYQVQWEETDTGYSFEVLDTTDDQMEVGERLQLNGDQDNGFLGVLALLDRRDLRDDPTTASETSVREISFRSRVGVAIAWWSDRNNVDGQVFACLSDDDSTLPTTSVSGVAGPAPAVAAENVEAVFEAGGATCERRDEAKPLRDLIAEWTQAADDPKGNDEEALADLLPDFRRATESVDPMAPLIIFGCENPSTQPGSNEYRFANGVIFAIQDEQGVQALLTYVGFENGLTQELSATGVPLFVDPKRAIVGGNAA